MNLFDCCLLNNMLTYIDRYYLRHDYPRKVFTSLAANHILLYIYSKILKSSEVRESHFLLHMLSIEIALSRFQPKYVIMYEGQEGQFFEYLLLGDNQIRHQSCLFF